MSGIVSIEEHYDEVDKARAEGAAAEREALERALRGLATGGVHPGCAGGAHSRWCEAWRSGVLAAVDAIRARGSAVAKHCPADDSCDACYEGRTPCLRGQPGQPGGAKPCNQPTCTFSHGHYGDHSDAEGASKAPERATFATWDGHGWPPGAGVQAPKPDASEPAEVLCSMCRAAVDAGGFDGGCINCDLENARELALKALRSLRDGDCGHDDCQPCMQCGRWMDEAIRALGGEP